MTVFAQNKKWREIDGFQRLKRIFGPDVAVFCEPGACQSVEDIERFTGLYDVIICDFSPVIWFRLMEAVAAREKWVMKVLIENRTQAGSRALFNARGQMVREGCFEQAACA